MDIKADQEACMAIAAPLLPGLYAVLETSRQIYFGEGYSDHVRAQHSVRSVASLICDHAEKELLLRCQEWPGAHPIEVRGLKCLNYKDQLLFRLKKVNAEGRHSNYQTKQQRDYDNQLTIPKLPEPAVRLTAGYQMNASGDGFERIMIARPISRGVAWSAQIEIVDEAIKWTDITLQRFAGTERYDFDAKKSRKGR